MKQKIFAYDLDGTLLKKNNTVAQFNKNAMLEVQKRGHLNVIATGRGLHKILPLLENKTLEHIDYCVCSNGTLFYDTKNKKTTVLKTLDPKNFDVIKKIALKYDLILTLDTDKFNGTVLSNDEFPQWMAKTQIMDMNILNRSTYQKLEEIIHDPKSKITQIALRNPLELAEKITEEVRSCVDQSQCEVYLTNSIYTDVNPKGASKFGGLLELGKTLKIEEDDMICFGDSGNDIEMLSCCGIGICMENGTQEAKEAADRIIGNHETNAIGETLLKILDKLQKAH